MNLRALSWITEDWRRRWQIDHGLSSIAYLKLVRGEWAVADRLFAASTRAWDSFDGAHIKVFDNYPLHRAELLMRADDHDGALRFLHDLQEVATTNNWPEAVARGHLHLADVYRSNAQSSGDAGLLVHARNHLTEAASVTAGMAVADVLLAHMMGRVRVELVAWSMKAEPTMTVFDVGALLGHMDRLMADSQLRLLAAEVVAARGFLDLENNDGNAAEQALRNAVQICEESGNRLFVSSTRFVVGHLGAVLGIATETGGVSSEDHDPLQFVGEQLETQELLSVLELLDLSLIHISEPTRPY